MRLRFAGGVGRGRSVRVVVGVAVGLAVPPPRREQVCFRQQSRLVRVQARESRRLFRRVCGLRTVGRRQAQFRPQLRREIRGRQFCFRFRRLAKKRLYGRGESVCVLFGGHRKIRGGRGQGIFVRNTARADESARGGSFLSAFRF